MPNLGTELPLQQVGLDPLFGKVGGGTLVGKKPTSFEKGDNGGGRDVSHDGGGEDRL